MAAEEEEDAMSDTKYGYVGEDASSFGRSTKTGGPLKKDEIGKAGDHDDARSSRSGRSRKSGKSGKSGQQTYRSSVRSFFAILMICLPRFGSSLIRDEGIEIFEKKDIGALVSFTRTRRRKRQD